MPRVFDLDGHPWSDVGRQAFRLTTLVQDLGPDDLFFGLTLHGARARHRCHAGCDLASETGRATQVFDAGRLWWSRESVVGNGAFGLG